MLKKKLTLLTLIYFLTLFSAVHAVSIELQTLTTHIRETFSYAPDWTLSLEPSAPSELQGFEKYTLKISRGDQFQIQSVYVAPDRQHYFVGNVQNMTTQTDKVRQSMIQLEEAPSKGKENAPVTIVEYSDFQCPTCKNAHETVYKNLFKEYKGKVRLVYKYYPLTQYHPWAEAAAIAAECAKLQNPEKFWNLQDSIFANQSSLSIENIRGKFMGFAQSAKLDMKWFSSCYDTKQTLDTVRRNVTEGQAVGVRSTPTFIVNGHLITGANYQNLKILIDEFLNNRHAVP